MRERHRHQGKRRSAPVHAPGETVVTVLPDGKHAVIERIAGGHEMAERLHNLGLRPGKRICKLGTMPGSGPVMLDCEGVRVALGRQIASRIVVAEPPAHSGEEMEQ